MLPLTNSHNMHLGVVVIGRNEGERLRRCLLSLKSSLSRITYVDSGSTDQSVQVARDLADSVVELDPATPFTAARARNAGFAELVRAVPELEYVFFVDGDCEVVDSWLGTATAFLDSKSDCAVVCGKRRERFPDQSVYNLLCDIEWTDPPAGECRSCGGDMVARVRAIRDVDGYRADLICGEEPEMCVRLRSKGWKIWHLDASMTIHDAAMFRFSQWWRRTLRGGYAFAQGAALHGAAPERHFVAERKRACVWGLVLPSAILLLTGYFGWAALLLLGAYPLQIARLTITGPRPTFRENAWRAVGFVMGKFPEAIGVGRFYLDRLRHVRSAIIEYK